MSKPTVVTQMPSQVAWYLHTKPAQIWTEARQQYTRQNDTQHTLVTGRTSHHLVNPLTPTVVVWVQL